MQHVLADRGKRVIVAGLDQDYLGKPFDPMPQLLAIAEYITKTQAICMVCGNPASHTQRLVASDDRVLLGAQGTYEARCRACFDPFLSGPRTPRSGSPSRATSRSLRWTPHSATRSPGSSAGPRPACWCSSASASCWRTCASASSCCTTGARRRATLLTWTGHKPRFYGLNLGLGVVFAILTRAEGLHPRRPLDQLFGEAMMLMYYGYLFPLSVRIERGFYRDGVLVRTRASCAGTMCPAVSWKERDAGDPGADL